MFSSLSVNTHWFLLFTTTHQKQIRAEDQTSLFVHSNFTGHLTPGNVLSAGISEISPPPQRSHTKEKGSPVTIPHVLNKSVFTDRTTPVIWHFSGQHTLFIIHSYSVNGNSVSDPLKMMRLRHIWILEETRVLQVFISAFLQRWKGSGSRDS